jgi:hypothetical protein
MSKAKPWWMNQELLKTQSIYVDYNVARDTVIFRKTFAPQPGQQISQWVEHAVDRQSLECGRVPYTYVENFFNEAYRCSPNYRHSDLAPTNRELSHPSVQQAWQEFLLVRALATNSCQR